jgi:hypothetical protein
VDIHLFSEASCALEGFRQGTAVDEKIAGYGAEVETLGEAVEKSGFTGAWRC